MYRPGPHEGHAWHTESAVRVQADRNCPLGHAGVLHGRHMLLAVCCPVHWKLRKYPAGQLDTHALQAGRSPGARGRPVQGAPCRYSPGAHPVIHGVHTVSDTGLGAAAWYWFVPHTV